MLYWYYYTGIFFHLQIAQSLKKAFLFNAHMELIQDPRQSRWRKAARGAIPESVDSLTADASAVSEAMNVAYAHHETTNEHTESALMWIENVIESTRAKANMVRVKMRTRAQAKAKQTPNATAAAYAD